jgi:uncharacterized membrane protein YbhN (UPF0104 family)
MLKRIPWRAIIAVAILILTVALFVGYFNDHADLRHKLAQVSPAALAGLIVLYFGFVGCLSLINSATVRLCRAKMDESESLLLSAYSSVINFFGPLQSGPIFRGLYLKKKHAIKLRDYTLASFVYYFFYALFSGLLLVSGIFKWWTVPLGIVSLALVHFVSKSKLVRFKGINSLALEAWPYMALASALQIAVLVAIYYLELHSVTPGVRLSQALIYTGAANFSLFVALTPGAIGFRESFLVFSQQLHGISTTTIIAANAIDRGVYILLLGILALFIFGSHARTRLTAVTKSAD